MLRIFITIFLTSKTSLAISDYCSLCTNHIACNNPGNWAPICPNDAVLVEITPEIQNSLVDAHNSYRNLIASGGVVGYNSAVKMNKMVRISRLCK